MITEVNKTNQQEFENLLKHLWENATLEDCKKDAKVTKQFMYYIDNKAVGLLTCSIKREYVAGCDTNKVAHLEGLYVLPEHRRKGIAAELVNHFRLWAKTKGCKEMASDVEVDNQTSLQVHKKLGFEVVETTIHLKQDI